MRGNPMFLLIAIGVFLLIYWYVFSGIKTLTSSLQPNIKKGIYVIYWLFTCCSVGVLVVMFLGLITQLPIWFRTISIGLIMVLFLTKLVFVLFLLMDDVQRILRWVYAAVQNMLHDKPASEGNAISRSDFLLKAGLAASSIPFIGMTYGIVVGAHDYTVRKKRIVLKNLPDSWNGLKIVQLSDIHSGSFFNKTAVQRGIDMVLKQKPDIIFFTGDLVNNKADEMDNFIDLFSQLKAPLGIYSTLGNHDYGDYVAWDSADAKKANLNQLIQIHKNMGWDILMNEHRILKKNGEEIAILGIENWGAKGHFPKYGKMSEAYPGTEHVPVKLLLSHDPSHWDAEVRPKYSNIDITFSGHTHGFQFGIEKGPIKWSPVQWMYEQWGGLYKKNEQYLYVNRGFGYIGFPGRLGIPPEITVIELYNS
jgi:predicted MPP superfamily phosphohydrolase